ncbi:helix-turn-helix domain-containing protein [Cohnella zeiphila]|uniref:Helix-turn-helix transcriptional regulator n=1 Tax=Cohnella zeiphila TaxID=2761120 RepID=A0A7X0VZ06_9BACL|nr:helix-turn-helix transcriptional regulator [Cohnella zeiphila]MBB6735235.1 helix-turn-helix transcriptional regulator [Cohnella zeiphila]
MNMGERLRELRLKRNISQEEVARHIGITRSAYSHYEINNRQPVYETLMKLAAFFDVSLDYIIGGVGSNQTADESAGPDSREIMRLLQDMNHEQRKQSISLMHGLLNGNARSKDSGLA